MDDPDPATRRASNCPCLSASRPSETVRSADVGEQNASRFIGFLSPESVFAAQKSRHTDIGVWLNARQCESNPRSSAAGHLPSLVSILPRLRQEVQLACPDQMCWAGLSRIYFEKVQPFCPVITETDLTQWSGIELATLKQLICLGAAPQPDAKSFLKLPYGGSNILDTYTFCSHLSNAVRTTFNMGYITNNRVLVQAATLMFLFYNGPRYTEVTAYFCSLAVYYAQTIGLHIDNTQDHLFYCVWVIDRLNAAINGRPILIHDRDVRVSLATLSRPESVIFRVVSRITSCLDQVIGLYRPSQSLGSSNFDGILPEFESIMMSSNACNLEEAVCASLELYYHVVAVLSCRSLDSNTSSTSAKRLLSAHRITSLVQAEYPNRLPMTLVVPYGVSLALSVAYRQLRQTQLATERRRALGAFYQNAETLDRLGATFESARGMAGLARETLRELDRVHARSPHADSGGVDAVEFVKSTSGSVEEHVHAEQRFHGSADWDFFSSFDPDFPLHDVDAILQGNLELAFLPATSAQALYE